ncbi:hypothetical protein TanjilG_11191 [Lupinus angustifolius]|uniref:Uncharacterized protein n=1 Tax=Lupinus angustifolius TaxID=3871 RepID=A0A1J7HIU5_LUPAN|nr:hypothetical protein TanjilG_11191 [Lupinus angustifolius]
MIGLLKLPRDTIASGKNPNKALDYAIRASKSFNGVQFEEAVQVLDRFISLLEYDKTGSGFEIVKFSGYMQHEDTYSMIGQLDRSILCHDSGLKIQIEALDKSDRTVAETCR